MSSATIVKSLPIGEPFSDKAAAQIELMRKELKKYVQSVRGNPDKLNETTCYIVEDGSRYEPELLIPIPEQMKLDISRAIIRNVLKGMKVNGKKGQWNVGFLGSRWYDHEDSRLYACRVAFYSKEFYGGEWKYPKPFVLKVMMEKDE